MGFLEEGDASEAGAGGAMRCAEFQVSFTDIIEKGFAGVIPQILFTF
jgi:hypothetical protein